MLMEYPIQIILLIGTGKIQNKLLIIESPDGVAHFPYTYLQPDKTLHNSAGELLTKYTGIHPAWVQIRLAHIFDSPEIKDKQERRYITTLFSCLLPEINELYEGATWKSIQELNNVTLLPEHDTVLTQFAIMGGF